MARLRRWCAWVTVILCVAALGWARPWAAAPVRQRGTGRVLARMRLTPWRRVTGAVVYRAPAVRRLRAKDLVLANADLTHWHLEQAQLDRSRLAFADARGMTLWHSRLQDVRLVGAILDGTRLHRVDLTGVSLRRARCRNMVISYGRWRDVDLRGADLRDAALHEVVFEPGVDLRGADLRGATLAGVDLRHARMDGVQLAGARLTVGTRLPTSCPMPGLAQAVSAAERAASRMAVSSCWALGPTDSAARLVQLQPGADLRGYQIVGAELLAARLRGADLRGSALCFSILPNADLRQADLSGANLTGASLTGARLTGANLSGSDLSGANLVYADLEGAILAGCRYDSSTVWPSGFTPPIGADGGSRSVAQASSSTAS
ncbi:MAG: pentapeptide repeat-containing protein [Armatimonadetes bacterium]|nr:pentapeptide repeat-containing protein [Armatimonadota bacterium]